jgi:CMP-N,N'-diacetyllegionaminic acid synthase
MNIVGIIPARGGSKRLKDKNILPIKEKPLIGYVIEAALASKLLDKVVVSTDSEKIIEVVERHYQVQVIKRPDEFAKDDSLIEEALLHAVEYLQKSEGYKADIVVWMQANIPIKEAGLIDAVIKKLIQSDADSCVTVREAEEVLEVMKAIDERGMLIPLFKDVDKINYQEFPKRYLLDGSVLAMRSENLFKTRGIRKAHIYLGNNVIPVIQKKKMYSLEVDTYDEFLMAEYYISRICQQEGKSL